MLLGHHQHALENAGIEHPHDFQPQRRILLVGIRDPVTHSLVQTVLQRVHVTHHRKDRQPTGPILCCGRPRHLLEQFPGILFAGTHETEPAPIDRPPRHAEDRWQAGLVQVQTTGLLAGLHSERVQVHRFQQRTFSLVQPIGQFQFHLSVGRSWIEDKRLARFGHQQEASTTGRGIGPFGNRIAASGSHRGNQERGRSDHGHRKHASRPVPCGISESQSGECPQSPAPEASDTAPPQHNRQHRQRRDQQRDPQHEENDDADREPRKCLPRQQAVGNHDPAQQPGGRDANRDPQHASTSADVRGLIHDTSNHPGQQLPGRQFQQTAGRDDNRRQCHGRGECETGCQAAGPNIHLKKRRPHRPNPPVSQPIDHQVCVSDPRSRSDHAPQDGHGQALTCQQHQHGSR